jgi:hypothetical protein
MAGRKIDDRSSWVGGASKGSVFPEGVKHKQYSSAEGAGALGKYEDTSEAIHSMQEMGIKKAKAHAAKTEYRN